MPLGAPVLNTVGALTAPDAIGLSLGSSIATLKDYGLYHAVALPATRSVMISHGQEAMRHLLTVAGTNVSYRLGLLAPQAAQTVASTASKSAATITFTVATVPVNNDAFQIIVSFIYTTIAFKTTLSSGVTNTFEVKIGSGGTGAQNLATTIANIQKLFNGQGTEGTEWHNGYADRTATYLRDVSKLEVSATTATTVTVRALVAGSLEWTSIAESIDSGGSWSISAITAGVGGTGTDPSEGTYQYGYQHIRQGDGGESGRSDTVELTQEANCNVNQTAFVAASARFGATHYRQLRTEPGGTDLHRIQDTATGTGEPYVDSTSNTALVGVNDIPYDEAIHRLYEDGPPTIGRYGAYHKGSAWCGGVLSAADYSKGTASVTNGSYSVTLTGARAKENWIGRTYRTSGDTVSYLVVDVTEHASAPVLKLNVPYGGTTNASANYIVSDERNPFGLSYTEPLFPNIWTPTSTVDDVTSPDPAGLFGITPAWDSLVVHTKTGLWRIVGGGDSPPVLQHIGEGMGSYSGHGVVDVEGTLYWIGRDGIFKWSGAGDPVPLSKLAAAFGEFPRGIQRTLDRVSLDASEGIVATYNPSTRTIIWAVPLDGETRNNYAIIYDTSSGAFTVDRVPSITALASVPGVDSVHRTLGGSAFGDVFEFDIGYSDGCYGVEPVQAFSAYTASTKTCSGLAGLPTTSGGLAGVPVWHVSSTGVLQREVIATNTATTFVTVGAWDTAPADGTFVIGGIVLDVQTAQYDFEAPGQLKWLDRTQVAFAPSTDGELYVAAAVDQGTPALYANRTLGTTDYADLSNTDGEKEFPNKTTAGVRIVQRFLAITPGYDVTILGFISYIGSLNHDA